MRPILQGTERTQQPEAWPKIRTIELVEGDTLEEAKGAEAVGLYEGLGNSNPAKITLAQGQARKANELAHTLAHEAAHAAWYEILTGAQRQDVREKHNPLEVMYSYTSKEMPGETAEEVAERNWQPWHGRLGEAWHYGMVAGVHEFYADAMAYYVTEPQTLLATSELTRRVMTFRAEQWRTLPDDAIPVDWWDELAERSKITEVGRVRAQERLRSAWDEVEQRELAKAEVPFLEGMSWRERLRRYGPLAPGRRARWPHQMSRSK